ncbi:FecCD family ABC transporter permease [Gynuella sunshinyii]|uniref:ABC-type Fe3+-siderophore transport system, permease component n=1 Tax=Gynuella sunshinyii YC6258 TaxID=1445510 RepID=A0A0C5VV86_9GAMM|nr:iron ABC transporter permease [Gynuella sunshinyii]AJQ94324.1 ABC-type Fe3+-siderophore transport system, permease component [Gynuella sunshinyii YC6258]
MLHTTTAKTAGLLICSLVLLAAAVASIAFGQTRIPLNVVIDALFHYDDHITEHIIIQSSRLNRAVLAVVIGTNLACAGTMLQALTRNALASPSLFGINAGALFFIVAAFSFFSLTSLEQYIWVAFMGATVAGLLVYLLGYQQSIGFAPIQVVLAGAAITALFVAFTQGLLILNRESLEGILFWLGGSLSSRTMAMIIPFLPLFALAWIVTMIMTRQMNLMLLNDEIAKGLGQRIIVVRLVLGTLVIVLAGGSVALAGMIGFVGLIIPHLARMLFGRDHRWVLPAAAMFGAILLLLADTLSRFVVPPQELPVGVMTAFLGTPVFIAIARRRSPVL